LTEFLEALAREARSYLVSEPGLDRRREEISKAAAQAASNLRETSDLVAGETLSGLFVERTLGELRQGFSSYTIFALAVGVGEQLREAARELARVPLYGQLLVLVPDQDVSDRNFEVLDPVPAFSFALHAASDWPGFVFWTRTGASAFARPQNARELLGELERGMYEWLPSRGATAGPDAVASLDDVLRGWVSSRPSSVRRLLHLSDLHIGTKEALENQPTLESELRDVVKSVDRVVITGDLFDTPKNINSAMFAGFKHNITHLANGREPVVITGNHDQRLIGMFGENYKQVALIGSTKVIIDDQAQMVFICLNSSEEGNFARGKITAPQLKHVGAEYRNLTATRPELKAFLPIVLVHHHPFSFDVPPETWMQRALSALRIREERFLEMVDAQDLHLWCLDWQFKTILHGHKHKARYVAREVRRGEERMQLTAVGCGSSLGAEGSPLSYNVLEWSQDRQQWVVSFYESVNGGAFREVAAFVSPENANRRRSSAG